jgi:hypothetical protein
MMNRTASKTPTQKIPIKKPYTPGTESVAASHMMRKPTQMASNPIANKAASVAGERPTEKPQSAYGIMVSRIANRVAEVAENVCLVEKKYVTSKCFRSIPIC